MQTLRDIMDAQRFDMTLKRKHQMPENITHTTHTISLSPDDMPASHDEDLALSSRRSLSIITEARSSLESYEPLIFAINGDETSTNTPVSAGSSTSATYISQGSSVDIEDDANCPKVHTTDVYEHDTHSTIRTIIRPIARSPLLRCFSPPSSPLSRSTSPSTSSLKGAASALNLNGCFSSNAFEEEVDLIEQRRAQETRDIEVTVTRKIDQRIEERLRAVVEQTAYEDPGSGMSSIRSRVVSVCSAD